MGRGPLGIRGPAQRKILLAEVLPGQGRLRHNLRSFFEGLDRVLVATLFLIGQTEMLPDRSIGLWRQTRAFTQVSDPRVRLSYDHQAIP